MAKSDKILDEFYEDKENRFLNKFIGVAKGSKGKADAIVMQKAIQEYYKIIVVTIILIIGINYFFDMPLLFHKQEHSFLAHPILWIKDVFFNWGPERNCFIYSFKGLYYYFTGSAFVYSNLGFLKASWCNLTQFSPIWGFAPLCVLMQYIFYLRTESLKKEAEQLAKFLEIKEKSDKNIQNKENENE